ncbi:MAG: glycoside hydrolase family 3 C-terminal domain-containing protein, partial [Chitinispirillaceae bacterium]|nr:glycoside hydrolase family 3 C-terminal domain-containing protein [Chitinispirillaceae bacterium]
TDANGAFLLNGASINPRGSAGKIRSTMFVKGQNVVFNNVFPQFLKVELFDMTGKRASDVFNRLFDIGTHTFRIASLISGDHADGLYIARISKGSEAYTVPFNSLGHTGGSAPKNTSGQHFLTKKQATADTLIVAITGYLTAALPLDSDVSIDFGNITLLQVDDPDAVIEKKVDSLLLLMTTDEKIAQTAEVLVDIISTDDLKNNMYGSVFNGGGCPFPANTKETWVANLDAMHVAAGQTRLGIPILYGIDAVHGIATIEGATVFPHNIGMGCTGDTALVAKMANITAKECRAVGVNLNFGPAISVVRDERWGRSYEGYGETPEINSLMATAYVRGLQGYGDMTRPDAVAACAKHFIGDGGTTDGVNGGVTELSDATMRALHLPPYQAAVAQGVASIMPSYNAWSRNGQSVRCTNDHYSLTDLLKNELHFNGFCLSDWDAIPRTVDSEVYTAENVTPCINAGIDMAMIATVYSAQTPYDKQEKIRNYVASFKQSAETGTIPSVRLNDAVKRILRTKFRLNLFADASSNATLLAEFGSAEHRTVARECVRKSLVLLKNESSALPLLATDNVAVVGPWANNLGAQCGGWTITWQGGIDPAGIAGTTILKGLQDAGGSNVTFDETGDNLAAADKIVLVIGEMPYAEGQGDHGHVNMTGGYADCPQCDLYQNQQMSVNLADCPNAGLIDKCANSGKPVIIVLISGRPMIINGALEKSSAFVCAWLPGSEGAGVADVLYNSANFTGKLTHTWPASFEQIPVNTGAAFADEKQGSGGTPLFEYGYGLTY